MACTPVCSNGLILKVLNRDNYSNALILEVLNRDNYVNWRSRLETYLLAKDLWEVIEAPAPTNLEDDEVRYKVWRKKNAKALYAIQNSCGTELFTVIREIRTAKGAWEALVQECKVVQGYDENNPDHLLRYRLFLQSVRRGDWDKAKKCLGEVDVRSVVLRAVAGDGEMALHVAAMEGHVHIVKELVRLISQEEMKTKFDFGQTALHVAAAMGHIHVVKALPVLLMGEVKDDDGDTALHIAVQEGQVAIVKELVLLMRQEDLKIRNNKGYTALHLAVDKGNVPMVNEFVTKEKGDDNGIGEDEFDQYIPFTINVTNGDWDKANKCLKELDPSSAATARDPSNNARTALHVAARKGYVDVIKEWVLLLKGREQELELKSSQDFIIFGSGVNSEDSEGVVVKKAKYMVEQYKKTLGYILESQDAYDATALHFAVAKGNLDIVKELAPLMRQESLELKQSDGSTALHLAVSKGNVHIVKELVPLMREEGLEIKDVNGDTALHQAVMNGDMHIVRELMPLMRPEALEEKDGQGYTALSSAIKRFKDAEVCRMAKQMAEKNSNVFDISSAPQDDIPVVVALRLSKWKSARYLYSVTPLEVLDGPHGCAFLCCCLNSSKTIDLAWDLLQHCPKLAMTVDERTKTIPMLGLARMSYAFFSGKQLTRWQRWIYNRIHIRGVAQANTRDISINVLESEDDHESKRDFISSVINLYRRLTKGLQKLSGIHHIYKMKSTHEWLFKFLQSMGEATKDGNFTPDQLDMVKTSMFKAIQQGHFEFVTHICKANPELLNRLNNQAGKGIFHFSIESRQKEVYSLFYGLEEEERHRIGISIVNMDNNLLHYAANLSLLPQFDHIQDAGLQMQRELQWFKEVESVVPSEMYEHRNRSNDMTARELFTKNHKKLLDDAEDSIKRTATSCTVVGALIVTMMFAAAFTVPSGNDGNTGLPLFLDHKLFKVFIISDTVSLVSSTSSVITFLGLLTSRYAEDDFLKSLPTKIMIGLITLFFSIASMMIAFSCAIVIMLDGEACTITLSVLITSVPVMLFIWLLFPLITKTFISTYAPGIFEKKKKENIEVES